MPIITLQPALKDYIWGGRKLKDHFNVKTDLDIVAESWTLSCHPDGESMIQGTNVSLSSMLQDHSEYLGTHAAGFADFPIIVKLIDANQELSIQVHPNDTLGKQLENEYGKTEMWYVLDNEPDAFLYFGFKEDITEDEFRESIENDTILEKLNKVYVQPGDVLFVEAGIVHAIGPGIVIAEIQQNSNSTYRIYDYNRLGVDGSPRPLHIDKALLAANLKHSSIPVQSIETCINKPSILVTCPYFTVSKLCLQGKTTITIDAQSFSHLQVVEGSGDLIEHDKKTPFQKGDSFFIPASFGDLSLVGTATILISKV